MWKKIKTIWVDVGLKLSGWNHFPLMLSCRNTALAPGGRGCALLPLAWQFCFWHWMQPGAGGAVPGWKERQQEAAWQMAEMHFSLQKCARTSQRRYFDLVYCGLSRTTSNDKKPRQQSHGRQEEPSPSLRRTHISAAGSRSVCRGGVLQALTDPEKVGWGSFPSAMLLAVGGLKHLTLWSFKANVIKIFTRIKQSSFVIISYNKEIIVHKAIY